MHNSVIFIAIRSKERESVRERGWRELLQALCAKSGRVGGGGEVM